MEIKILQLIEGAKKAEGLTVIIDVFRAFSVEAYLFDQGVSKIIPVGKVEEAYAYKKDHPNYLLVGERKGKQLEGFDYGNSPSQIQNENLKGKTVVHTTSAGIQGIVNATHATKIITGSLVNARAIASYIQKLDPAYVSLVCMGLEGKWESEEDTLCAKYISSLLLNKPFDLKAGIEELKRTSGAKFFDENDPVFPINDFYLSTKENLFDFVIEYKDGVMVKVDL